MLLFILLNSVNTCTSIHLFVGYKIHATNSSDLVITFELLKFLDTQR